MQAEGMAVSKEFAAAASTAAHKAGAAAAAEEAPASQPEVPTEEPVEVVSRDLGPPPSIHVAGLVAPEAVAKDGVRIIAYYYY